MSDFNDKVIAEFRSSGGVVGGPIAGMPLVLLHHTGRRSGTERVSPVAYLEGSDGALYVFASAAGAPTHPDWYENLIASGTGSVEIGTESYPVTVRELEGDERARVFAEQVSKSPGFAEYEQKTAGVRTIPVLALTRS